MNLPEDLKLKILYTLEPIDLLRISDVNMYYNKLINNHSFWKNYYRENHIKYDFHDTIINYIIDATRKIDFENFDIDNL